MSGTYLYCQNPDCGEYLGSLGGDSCHLCGWRSGAQDRDEGPCAEDSAASSPQD